ncbi:uncharacterized protein LOC144105207 isoform X1 [Amblyomma americanum]
MLAAQSTKIGGRALERIFKRKVVFREHGRRWMRSLPSAVHASSASPCWLLSPGDPPPRGPFAAPAGAYFGQVHLPRHATIQMVASSSNKLGHARQLCRGGISTL